VQWEGEVQPCADPFHCTITPENTPQKIAETQILLASLVTAAVAVPVGGAPTSNPRCANPTCGHSRDEHNDGFGGCAVVNDNPNEAKHCLCCAFVAQPLPTVPAELSGFEHAVDKLAQRIIDENKGTLSHAIDKTAKKRLLKE